jgi:hypothetical protein
MNAEHVAIAVAMMDAVISPMSPAGSTDLTTMPNAFSRSPNARPGKSTAARIPVSVQPTVQNRFMKLPYVYPILQFNSVSPVEATAIMCGCATIPANPVITSMVTLNELNSPPAAPNTVK